MDSDTGPEPDEYDVVVVGGGAAGLSGAKALGRSRRSVLVVDSGSPRNAVAGHVHNYLGREGTSPLELLGIGRAEAEEYGVQVARGRVSAVRRGERSGTGFVVTIDDQGFADDEAPREVSARRLLVATGVADVLPEVPGLAERWGRDVLHCPYCHGWEVRDQEIAVLSTGPASVHQALLFRQLTERLVLVLAAGTAEPGADDLERLHARGIRVVSDPPVGVLVQDDALRGLRLASGDELACRAVVVSPGFRARAEFLAPLGLEPEPFVLGDVAVGTLLPAEPSGATGLPGVWVAGNVRDAMAQVVSSAAGGLGVGAMINGDLIEEETAAAVTAHREERQGFFERPAWEERYAGSEAVWSGRVNAQLEAEAEGLAAGRALDIGCGEGGDAIWLAQRGWTVTGLDFSAVALERAGSFAAAAGVADRVAWRQTDVRTLREAADGRAQRWDLVSSQFMHLPDGGMVDLTRRLAAAVAPRGTLLVVGHHPDDLHTGLRHGRPDFMFTPDQLRPALDPEEWEILAEVRPRQVTGPDGQPVTVRDSVLRARRLT